MRCDVTTSNSIQHGGALAFNILVFDLRVQLQHSTYQGKTLPFALIKVNTFICKREISGLSSPLRNVTIKGSYNKKNVLPRKIIFNLKTKLKWKYFFLHIFLKESVRVMHCAHSEALLSIIKHYYIIKH